MLPVYGLAECSVGLTFPPLGRGAARRPRRPASAFERRRAMADAVGGRRAPSSSSRAGARAARSTRCASSTTRARDVGERGVGRLVFRGPSMTAGYFRKPEATAAITLPGGWLDSGDLAYRADGEIHVSGPRART